MPDIHFLFRFRDLVAPTIEEHRRIIEERGWCWWGWWKRPSEDSRDDIWDDLVKQTNGGKTVEVGLFDSGSGNVYRAFVSNVIGPTKADHRGAENTINVPADEIDHVPLYYRDSPFSRAWMRLTRIDSEPIDFFNNYSFAEAPKVPNYLASMLERFVRKKITDPDELRGMDTTIWRVQPSLVTDSSQALQLADRRVSSAISGEVIQCKSNKILHLTDVHFAIGANRDQHVWSYDSEGQAHRTMVGAITSALKQHDIGLVIISGDFTFIGDPNEFAEARAAISLLRGNFDLGPEHLVIVPGNHDIQWTTDAVYDSNAKVRQAPQAAMQNYREFYRQLCEHDPDPHLSMGRRFALPCGLTVEVCGINSSTLETGKNFLAGMGRIDEGAFADVAEKLGWTDAQTLALRVLVIHHHLALIEDLEPSEGYGKGYGLAVDAVRVQRLAAKLGVHLALHGHKHRSFIWRSTVYELPEHAQKQYRLGDLSIIGGGSAGSRETEASSNYFNVITATPGELKVDIFRSRDQGIFDLMQEWSAELSVSKEQNGLKLADWIKAP